MTKTATTTDDILFLEKQQFRQKWLWFLLLGGFVLVMASSVVPMFLQHAPFDQIQRVVLVTVVPIVVVVAFFWKATLETTITSTSIYYRWIPFFKLYRELRWSDVDLMTVGSYGFVGYGYRLSPTYGQVHNVNGQIGLLLRMKNGKRYVIGTQKETEMQKVIDQIRQLSPTENER